MDVSQNAGPIRTLGIHRNYKGVMGVPKSI